MIPALGWQARPGCVRAHITSMVAGLGCVGGWGSLGLYMGAFFLVLIYSPWSFLGAGLFVCVRV